MPDEYEIQNELEAQRNMDERREEEPTQPEPYKMGVGSYVLILFAFFVDIIEFLTTYSGVGIPIAVVLGFLVDSAIFLAVGLSKNARKQWKRFALGAIGENFPVIAQAIEWIPIRTLSLIWMYVGMKNQGKKESRKSENDKNGNEQ